ncbi:STAS domain-containing protein [Williamsia soli]|uniref:STAS domain-containing protein n=1 Tax=Williamsia soli TaxID=364929 RepID=UPI001A9F535A|nr:STAS domain-containing protein [Williamsia soli]
MNAALDTSATMSEPGACIDIEVEEAGSALAMVRVRGEVDMLTTGRLSQVLHEAVSRFDEVVLDLSATTFLSSAGLDVIATATTSGGDALRIFAPTAPARRTFEICAPHLL